MFRSTRPLASCGDSRTWPLNVPVNALVGRATEDVDEARAPPTVAERPSRDCGVPARAAQPGRAGPLRYQPPIANGAARAVTVLATRRRGLALPAPTRQSTAP